MKRKIVIGILFAFLVASLFYSISVPYKTKSQYHSSMLKKIIFQDENEKKTDYVDTQGKLTLAADLGYASSVCVSKGTIEIERYYDENRQPVCRNSGNYAILREFDQRGNIIGITYLGADNTPIMVSDGYAREKREYNKENKIVKVYYYDTDNNPVCSASSGFGKINEYDENGHINRIVYIDDSDNPMIIAKGYSILTRKYYTSDGPEKGKVESEFYFDKCNHPIALSLGQYGIHKEYNDIGQETVITYLDEKGDPIINKRGYTTAVRTYLANNSILTEHYYDIGGNTVALSEGQYGIRKENGKTVFLNRDGNEIFNLKNLFYNHSYLAVLVAIVSIIIAVSVGKKSNILLLIIAFSFILYLTMLFRDSTERKASYELFQSFKTFFVDNEKRIEIMRNIWLFIPLGAILYRFSPKESILLVVVAFSALIEGIQFFARIGFCSLDDIISNSIGGWIGFESAKILVGTRWKKDAIRCVQ